MTDRPMLPCPGCGFPLQPADSDETLDTCQGCRASLRPDIHSRITLVTRPEDPALRKVLGFKLSPELLDAYAVGGLLGAGNMGAVYRGVQKSTERTVAIKFLVRMDRESLARFVREGKLLARIAHPGVLRVLDVGEVDGHPFLVTELAPGGSLRSRLDRDGPMSAARATALAADLAAALDACHAASVVHRDLKPANVLYDEQDRPRIADLGIARSLVAGEGMTDTGDLIGTPLYMSPEQARGERVGPPSDVYGLGCTLYEALTGSPPFKAKGLSQLLKMHTSEPPRPVDQVVDKLPAAFARLVMAMLAKDASARPTAAGVLEAIRNPALMASRVIPRPQVSRAPTPSMVAASSTPTWPAPRIALALFVVSVVLAGLAVWLGSR